MSSRNEEHRRREPGSRKEDAVEVGRRADASGGSDRGDRGFGDDDDGGAGRTEVE